MDPPKFFHRRSTRLKGYDYSTPGAYFVTICVNERKNIFGNITNGAFRLNGDGKIADRHWNHVAMHFKTIEIDTHVVMPNHVHAIITLVETKLSPPQKQPKLGHVVAYYKYQTTKEINLTRERPTNRVWQRGFYDHIIRNDDELSSYRQYILENPLKWELDEYYGES